MYCVRLFTRDQLAPGAQQTKFCSDEFSETKYSHGGVMLHNALNYHMHLAHT